MNNKGEPQQRRKSEIFHRGGVGVYSILCNLFALTKPRYTLLEDIIKSLRKHYDPTPLDIAENYRFETKDRDKFIISEYTVALQKCFYNINFEGFLNRALRDRFVIGYNSGKIQSKLITTSGKSM